MNTTQDIIFLAALAVLSFGGGVLAIKLIQRMRTR